MTGKRKKIKENPKRKTPVPLTILTPPQRPSLVPTRKTPNHKESKNLMKSKICKHHQMNKNTHKKCNKKKKKNI